MNVTNAVFFLICFSSFYVTATRARSSTSVDTRDSDFGAAEHWSGDALGARASFRADRHPAALVVANVRAKDEALYRCRVDFRLAQTRNAHVNLTVVGNHCFVMPVNAAHLF